MTTFSYWIGVDHREPEATRVCEASARAYSKQHFPIHHIDHLDMRRKQWFDRPWRISEDGTYYDERDGKPFSTQFAHTRFLTPLLARETYGSQGWALFTDCDWLWLASPLNLLKYIDNTKTAMVVPHNFVTAATTKMDNQPQSLYNRKLWSALTLWNLASKKLPTVEMVNEADGGFLHRFGWLDDQDIGFLPESYHWLPNYSPTTDAAKAAEAANKPVPIEAIHFTHGVPLPGMTQREVTPFDQFWTNELIGAYRDAP